MLELKGKLRNELGKKVSALRRTGVLPAVVYGAGVESTPISVSAVEFQRLYKQTGSSVLFKLSVDGKEHNVLIHDVTMDPLTGNPLHMDFHAVRMDKTIRAKVPVEFIGESPAVKNDSGILVKVMQEIEIEALPMDLPHVIQADISSLEALESKLLVGQLSLPDRVKTLASADEIVALVETPRSEEELTKLNEVVAAEPVEVKTEREVQLEKKELKVKAETVEE